MHTNQYKRVRMIELIVNPYRPKEKLEPQGEEGYSASHSYNWEWIAQQCGFLESDGSLRGLQLRQVVSSLLSRVCARCGFG